MALIEDDCGGACVGAGQQTSPLNVSGMSDRFTTRNELFSALEIHVRYLTDPASVILGLFPYATVMPAELWFDGVVVSTAHHFNPAYGAMGPGEWVHLFQKTGFVPEVLRGFDVFKLIASHHNAKIPNALDGVLARQNGYSSFRYQAEISQKAACGILSEVFGLTYADADQQSRRLKGWQQVRAPLFAAADIPPKIRPEIPGMCQEWHSYKSRAENVRAFVFYYLLQGGEQIPVYVTLMHNKRESRYQWFPIFPEKPLMLFNGNQIFSSPMSEVVFCPDELSAELWRKPFSVGTAVPGGLNNVLDADVDGLRGRNVVAYLSPEQMKHGRLFREKLRKAGVCKAEFCVSQQNGERECWSERRSFDDLERIAAENGVSLAVPASEIQSASIRAIISRPAEPIPGGDVSLRTLLAPIIHEGDLVWLYAEPKVGKTWLALALAQAVAVKGGKVGKWVSPEKWGVLYVDGEMKPSTLKRRIDKVLANPANPEKCRAFGLLSAKAQDEGFIRIDDERWQTEIERQLEGIHLLILDNFQSLTANAVGTMMQIRSWLHHITSNKVAVLIIDHTNRDGDLQGSLAKARNADLCIAMSVAGDVPDEEIVAGEEGEVVRILVEFPLGARELHGEQIAPFVLERRISEGGGLTFQLLDEGQIANEELINHDDRVRLRRMAAVCVLRERKPQMSYRKMELVLGWDHVTLRGDAENRKELGEAQKRYFEERLEEFRQLELAKILPEDWEVERSPKGGLTDG